LYPLTIFKGGISLDVSFMTRKAVSHLKIVNPGKVSIKEEVGRSWKPLSKNASRILLINRFI
jgi:hypothetical protein